jgi:anti-sigma B factor antagonist
MKYSIDKEDRYAIFKLNEENLNSLISPDLKSEFIFLRNEGVRNLILDLTNVKYVDSSGLSSILTANRLWKDFGSFIITGVVHAPVVKLIQISRLETILTIVPTLQESIEFAMMEDLQKELEQGSDE